MPSERWVAWEERKTFFNDDGTPAESYRIGQWPSLDDSYEFFIREYRTKAGHEVTDDEKAAFLDLMRAMLKIRPEEWITAEDVLNLERMVKWVLPDHRQSLEEDSSSALDLTLSSTKRLMIL
ncbi:hypothetical protein BDV12DRAFT_195888 [Aspergillus spectabilis]